MKSKLCDRNIGVVIPLKEEFDQFQDAFGTANEVLYFGSHPCYFYEVNSVGVYVILCAAMGNGPAQDATEQLLAAFPNKLDLVVCIGIGGAIHTDLKLGDVTIATSIADIIDAAKVSDPSDRGAKEPSSSIEKPATSGESAIRTQAAEFPDRPLYQLELMQRSFASVSIFASFIDQFSSIDNPAHREWEKACFDKLDKLGLIPHVSDLLSRFKSYGSTKTEKYEVSRKSPLVFATQMASGLVFGSKSAMALRVGNREFKVVETEAAGVARACSSSRSDIPFVIIRGISDFADATKSETETLPWRKYAAFNAMKYLHAVLNSDKFGPLLTGSPARTFDLSTMIKRFRESGELRFERNQLVYMWPVIETLVSMSPGKYPLWIAAQDLWSMAPILAQGSMHLRLKEIKVVSISENAHSQLKPDGIIDPKLPDRFKSNFEILRQSLPKGIVLEQYEWPELPEFHGCLYGNMLWYGHWQLIEGKLSARTDQRIINGDCNPELGSLVEAFRSKLERCKPVQIKSATPSIQIR